MLIKPIIVKELRHIIRDPRTLAILLALPIFLLIMFGYAISLDVKRIGLAVYDGDRSALSRGLVDDFTRTEYFTLRGYLDRPGRADALLFGEQAKIVLIIPPDFSEKLIRRETAVLQVLVDGSNPTVGSTAASYTELIVADFAATAVDGGGSIDTAAQALVAGPGGQGRRLPVEALPRIWFNPELSSARFLIPGLISFILMVSAVISTSLSIVREKERGTIEQLAVSPVRSIELLIGKTVPYFCIALVNAGCVLLASYVFFGMEIRGSYLVFFTVTVIFLLGCLALGILISTFIDTQQNAFMATVFLTVLPSYILSGFVFPIRNMPPLVQAFSYIVPNRYFLSALRSIMIRGVGIESFASEFVALCIFDLVVICLAVLRLRRLRRV
jgi:ABC-2 type transport system permease protein